MLKNILCKLTHAFNKTPQISNLSLQQTPQTGWFIWLLVIACLVIPPTTVAALSPNSVFFTVKVWGIEYQFQKGKVEMPRRSKHGLKN